MRKKFVLAITLFSTSLLAFTPTARADGDDVVTLKDGTRIHGTIVKQEPGKYVVIRQANGRETTISFDDVRRIDTGAGAPGGPAQSGHAQDGTTLGNAGGGLLLHGETTLEDAEAKRQAWLQRGGSLFSYAVRGQGYFMMLRKTMQMPSVMGYGGGEARLSYYAGGGGGGVRVAWMNLNLPDPKLGSMWKAIRIGTGADVQGGGGGIDVSIPGFGSSGQGFGMFTMTFPVYLGGLIGIGSYEGDEWHGVALKLQYQPSYSWSYISGGRGSSSGDFNWAGAELGVEFNIDPTPLEALAPRAHGEVFVFILPPVGDLPLFINVGGGAVWY